MIDRLKEENVYLKERGQEFETARERSDTVIMQFTRQMEQSQRLLEYHQEPWYRRVFRKGGDGKMGNSTLRIVFGENIEWLKIAFQAILQGGVAIGIFLLGVRFERRRRIKAEEESLRKIRAIFRMELSNNYKLMIRYTPAKDQKAPSPELLARMFLDLESSVYDRYLDRLCDLEEELMHSMYRSYKHIRNCIRNGKGHLEALHRFAGPALSSNPAFENLSRSIYASAVHQQGEATLLKLSVEAQRAIEKNLVLFDGGEKILESLAVEKGKSLEPIAEQK